MKKLCSAFAASLIAGAVASAQDAVPYELDLTTITTSTVYGDYWDRRIGSHDTRFLIFRALEDGVELWGMEINRGRCSARWNDFIGLGYDAKATIRVGKRDENFVDIEQKTPNKDDPEDFDWKSVQKIPLKDVRARLGKGFELNFSEEIKFTLDEGCGKIIEVKVDTNLGSWVTRFK